MKKAKGLKGLILVLAMVALVFGYYYYLSNRTPKKEPVQETTAAQAVLVRDMELDYPPSPKEVVKYYAEITKCFYEGEHTEEEIRQLGERARFLYDDELKATQTEEEYFSDLEYDIEDFKNKDMKISSYSTSASTDVEYKTTEKGELATLYCVFTIRQGKQIVATNQVFVLRKDAEEHWKILGWTLVKDNQNGNAE